MQLIKFINFREYWIQCQYSNEKIIVSLFDKWNQRKASFVFHDKKKMFQYLFELKEIVKHDF